MTAATDAPSRPVRSSTGTPTARSPSFWSLRIIFLVFTGAALLFWSWFRFEQRRHRDRAEPRDRASTDA